MAIRPLQFQGVYRLNVVRPDKAEPSQDEKETALVRYRRQNPDALIHSFQGQHFLIKNDEKGQDLTEYQKRERAMNRFVLSGVSNKITGSLGDKVADLVDSVAWQLTRFTQPLYEQAYDRLVNWLLNRSGLTEPVDITL